MIPGETLSGEPPALSRVLAQALAWQGLFSLKLGHAERARQLLAQSVEVVGQDTASGGETWLEGTCVLLEMGLALERARRANRPAALLLATSMTFVG